MTPLATLPPLPVAAAPLAGSEPARRAAPAVAPPALGAAAVTAVETGRSIRLDPRRETRTDPLEPPADPPPVKGLGIPPLNTRLVGDLDKIDDAPRPPPPGSDLSALLAALEPPLDATVDRRR